MHKILSIAFCLFFVAVVEGFAGQTWLTRCANPMEVRLAAIWSRGSKLQQSSELVNGRGPYVPSGLSTEEYAKIKKKEADRLKKLNYGAWGPRFKRSDVPDGDWMVMPSLWTNGFNAQPRGSSLSTNEGISSYIALAATVLRNMLPALLLSLIFIETMTTAFAMSRSSNLTARQALLTVLKVPSLTQLSLHFSSILKKASLKLAAIALVAPVMGSVLERVNRKRLWSNRKTIGVCVGVSLGSLSLWVLILRLAGTLVVAS